jgi:hypothetical protein
MGDDRGKEEAPDVDAIAGSFLAVGEWFSGLGEPDRVRRVVQALQADEPGEFRELLDGLPDFPGKCLTLCRAVRTIVEGEELREMRLCALRHNLTFTERLLAQKIYEKHFGPQPHVVVEGPVVTEQPPSSDQPLSIESLEIIWPSPYQDELFANGLVYCWKAKVSVPTWSLGPPSWQCVDLCS